MIRALCLALGLGLITGPAFGQDTPAPPVMTPQTCLAGWQWFAFAADMPPRLRAVQPAVTQAGWCRIDDSVADLRSTEFGSLIWRAEGVEEAVRSAGFPKSVEAFFEGIDIKTAFKLPVQVSGPQDSASLRIIARRAAQTQTVMVDVLQVDFGRLGQIALSANAGGLDLGSRESMQRSLGAFRVNEATLTMDTTRSLSKALMQVADAERTKAMWEDVIRALPASLFEGQSRRALVAFARALPDANGQFRLRMEAGSGLGMAQVVAGLVSLDQAGPEATPIAQALGLMLSGVTVDASWTPGN
jgi:hypothetical protein